MNNADFKVILTRKLPQTVENRLGELFDVTFNPADKPFDKNQLINALNAATVLVPTLTDKLTADILQKAGPQLELIANFGSGVDHIDVDYAHDHGIMVTNSPAISAADTADMTIALILTVIRRLKEGAMTIISQDWKGWAPSALLGNSIRDKKLGILGMGRIGSALAERARVFGLHIHYHNRTPVHPDTAARVQATYHETIFSMLSQVDILAICCPLTKETTHIINETTIATMNPGSYIINIARSGIIDEDALVCALHSGHIAGAGLDVLSTDNTINTYLASMKNVILLPHMGSATTQARHKMGETVILNIKMHQDGHKPPNMIIPNNI